MITKGEDVARGRLEIECSNWGGPAQLRLPFKLLPSGVITCQVCGAEHADTTTMDQCDQCDMWACPPCCRTRVLEDFATFGPWAAVCQNCLDSPAY